MLDGTTTLHNPVDLEAAQPAGPLANLADQPKPKRPPQTLLDAAHRCPKPNGRDRSVGENGDRYPGVLFDVPNTSWRVVVCAEGRQYIAQQREGRDRWASRKFFTNRRRLGVVLRQLVGARAFKAVQAKIEALPI
jgi:hypothetical protein